MPKDEKTNTFRCGVCDREITDEKPTWGIGGYACTPEMARQLGIPECGPSYYEVCSECREKEQGKGLQ
jgi:hypothetical protein